MKMFRSLSVAVMAGFLATMAVADERYTQDAYASGEVSSSSSQRRELFDFGWLFFFLHPCPPFGPPHSGCSSDDSSSSGSDYDATGYFSNDDSNGDDNVNSWWQNNGGGGGGGNVYSADDDTTASWQDNNDTSNPIMSSYSVNKLTAIMLAVAAVASLVALYAVALGQRKQETKDHSLRGSVARRMGLFSNFANSNLANHSNLSKDAPPSSANAPVGVEMAPPKAEV